MHTLGPVGCRVELHVLQLKLIVAHSTDTVLNCDPESLKLGCCFGLIVVLLIVSECVILLLLLLSWSKIDMGCVVFRIMISVRVE